MVMKLLAYPVPNRLNPNRSELFGCIGTEALALKGLETTPSQEA